jgi:hypothetical protein
LIEGLLEKNVEKEVSSQSVVEKNKVSMKNKSNNSNEGIFKEHESLLDDLSPINDSREIESLPKKLNDEESFE